MVVSQVERVITVKIQTIKYVTVKSTGDLSSPAVVNAFLEGWTLEGVVDYPYDRDGSDISDYSLSALKESLEDFGFAVLYFERPRP